MEHSLAISALCAPVFLSLSLTLLSGFLPFALMPVYVPCVCAQCTISPFVVLAWLAVARLRPIEIANCICTSRTEQSAGSVDVGRSEREARGAQMHAGKLVRACCRVQAAASPSGWPASVCELSTRRSIAFRAHSPRVYVRIHCELAVFLSVCVLVHN